MLRFIWSGVPLVLCFHSEIVPVAVRFRTVVFDRPFERIGRHQGAADDGQDDRPLAGLADDVVSQSVTRNVLAVFEDVADLVLGDARCRLDVRPSVTASLAVGRLNEPFRKCDLSGDGTLPLADWLRREERGDL